MNSIKGNGARGLTITEFGDWLRTFMGEPGDIFIECGIDAHAAIWNLAGGQTALRTDPKDGELIRTPWGPFKLSISKVNPPGSAYAVSSKAERILASIQDLQLITA